jgi:endonuclease G, mitochondrial
MKQFRSFHCATLAAVLLLTGCAHPVVVSRPAVYTAAQQQPQAGLSPEDRERVDRHCPFGIPKLDSRVNFGPTELVAHDGYVLRHSSTDKIPLWVCEFVEADQLTGKASRYNNFQPDPLLKPGQRAELTDYKGSGFDRGHQAPAGDQTKDARLKAETFYLSNMAPQVPAMNQQIWRELEDHVRHWMIGRGSGFIITGGMFYDPDEEDPHTAHGVIRHRVIGNGVSVPTHFYKIAVAKDSSGEWQTIGFVMENKAYKRPFQFADSIKPVDWIEQRTGIDFMPNLSAQEEKRLERLPAHIWN